MRNACDKKKEHMSKVKVKVTENTKTTIWAITSEPEVVETSSSGSKSYGSNSVFGDLDLDLWPIFYC